MSVFVFVFERCEYVLGDIYIYIYSVTNSYMYAANGKFPYTCICFVHGLNVLYVECLSMAMTNFQDHS